MQRMLSTRGLSWLIWLLLVVLAMGMLQGCAPSSSPGEAKPTPSIIVTSLPTNTPEIPTLVPTVPSHQPSQTATLFLPTQTVQPAPTSLPQATLPSAPDQLTQYRLEATLDYYAHALAVEETITYTNNTADDLSSIVLVVEAQRYPGAFSLSSITYASGERSFQFRLKDQSLTINLPQPLSPGQTTHLMLSYTLQLVDVQTLPQLRPYPLGYTDLQANFGDWYPYVPPYADGKGWVIHPAAIYGEHLVYDPADFSVAIRLQNGSSNLVIAAGASSEQDGEWTRYTLKAARSFAWSVSPYYETLTRTIEVTEGNPILLASYYFPYHAAAGKSLLDAMERSLSLYSELFGAYTRHVFAGVQADFIDGMEYDGLFFLSTDYYNWHRDTPDDFLTALAAHETAHQWWFSLVGNDQAMAPWLDEALCTYSERLYYEKYSPTTLDWWWAYRVNYYEPEGWLDLNIYAVPQVAGQYHLYREPVYLRGAIFLEQLRSLIGDEAFFETLRIYASRFAYRQANTADFFDVVRQQSTADLSQLISKYFSEPIP